LKSYKKTYIMWWREKANIGGNKWLQEIKIYGYC